jgi:hypothetical protein
MSSDHIHDPICFVIRLCIALDKSYSNTYDMVYIYKYRQKSSPMSGSYGEVDGKKGWTEKK